MISVKQVESVLHDFLNLIQKVSNKIYQTNLTCRCGFSTPIYATTLSSRDSIKQSHSLEECRSLGWSPQYFLNKVRLDCREANGSMEPLQCAPSLHQNAIPVPSGTVESDMDLRIREMNKRTKYNYLN